MGSLSQAQRAKLALEPALLAEEAEHQARLRASAEAAVRKWVGAPQVEVSVEGGPPEQLEQLEPLSDPRRPDEHRTAFVGPAVRARNKEHWRGMPATANDAGTPNPSAVPRSPG